MQGINKCLDIVSASPSTDVILKMYDHSFNAMKGSKSDTTWFKTKLKLAKLLLDRNEAGLLAKTLEELHKSCLGKDGKLDPKKGSNLIGTQHSSRFSASYSAICISNFNNTIRHLLARDPTRTQLEGP